MKFWILGLFILILSTSAIRDSFAFGKKQPPPQGSILDFKLGDISVGGSGCRSQASQITQEKNGNDLILKIRSAEYSSLLNAAEDGRTADNKGCAVSIPIVQLSDGARLKISQVTLKGGYDIRASVAGKASLEGFISGSIGKPQELLLNPSLDEVTGDLKFSAADLAQTCKQDDMIRLNTSISLQIPNTNFNVEARKSWVTVDELTILIHAESCQD